MNLINEICISINQGFHPLTIVNNPDGFLSHQPVCNLISQKIGRKVVVGSSLKLRIYYELNLKKNPEEKTIFIVTQGEMLPDIIMKANIVTFKITSLFPNFADKETISSLPFETLKSLYDRHMQGFVSSNRLSILLDDSEKVSDTHSEFGDADKRFLEINNPDWSDVSTIKEIGRLFVETVERDKFDEISSHLNDLNYDFQHFLDETYWNSLNANPFLRPQSVAGIIPHIKNNYGSDDRVALVVVDGMAFWQYEILRQALEENKIHPKNEDWVFSWIPSITALSRQAIFRGATPSLDYNQSPQSERNLWLSHWNTVCFPEYFYEKADISLYSNCKRLALVTVALDEKMHSSSRYADLVALTRIWAKDFAKTITQLKGAGYQVLLTTDHGNVLATGWRPFTSTEKVHLYGKMSRGHRHAIFMNEAASMEFKRNQGHGINSLYRNNWFAIRENQSFTTKDKKEITHGGSHLFEVMIPFIKY